MYIIATINIESKKLVNSKPENHFVSSFLILFLLKNTVTSKLAIKNHTQENINLSYKPPTLRNNYNTIKK